MTKGCLASWDVPGKVSLHSTKLLIYMPCCLFTFTRAACICIIVHRSALFCTLTSVQPQVRTGSEEPRRWLIYYETMDILKYQKCCPFCSFAAIHGVQISRTPLIPRDVNWPCLILPLLFPSCLAEAQIHLCGHAASWSLYQVHS